MRGKNKMSAKMALFLILIVAVLGVAVFVGGVQNVYAISGVTGADNDTTHPGLDGWDFTITWTPGDEPAGYTQTRVYIFPFPFPGGIGPSFPTISTLSTACGGPCAPRGTFFQFQQSSVTLPQSANLDSTNTAWNAGTQYRACVNITADSNSFNCSSGLNPFSVTSDTVGDTNAPQIDHLSASFAQAGVNAIINAFIIDDQTTSAQFSDITDIATNLEYFKLAYGANLVSAETRVDAVIVTGKLFQFTVPFAAVPAAGGTFQYYITAKDRAGNERFFCANPSATDSAGCKAAPFIVNTIAAGARTVSGIIRANTQAGLTTVESAKVFAAGFAAAAVTTGGDGTYTITGLPNNTPFDITAYRAGNTKNTRMEMVGTVDLVAVNININQGDLTFSSSAGGMFAGDMSPHVIFSGPAENAQNVPLGENIRVGLSQPLNSSTVNDSDASNAGSRVILTIDGSTYLGGTVTWCPNQAAAGCSALMPGDTNTILFNPASDFTSNTTYTLVVSEAVMSESGQSISGNRTGGGHRITFTASAGAAFSSGDLTGNFGSGGQYLPPYVKSTLPAPGNVAAPNVRPSVEFNESMSLGTLTATNIKLVKMPSTVITSTVSVDSTETRFVTLTPQTTPANTLIAGDYEIQVLGAVANARGMTMRAADQASAVAFRVAFSVGGSADSSPPTIYPMVASGGTIAVNEGRLEFGFSEPLAASTITSSNITLRRGATLVTASVIYNASENSVYVIPDAVFAPNTSYNVTFGTNVTDLSGNALASVTYTYTTGAADTTAPRLREARCDDYTCTMFFTEPMNHDSPADPNHTSSVLNLSNWTVERTAPTSATLTIAGKPITYDGENNSVTIQGIAGLAFGNTFQITAGVNIRDLARNPINTTGSANILIGAVENSQATFGSFGDTGMFGPPVSGVGTMGPPPSGGGGAGASITLGGEFKPQGFGNFTAEQVAMGQADMAYPFNPMASQDSNVFQVRFSPGAVLQNGDLVELTFPRGTGITATVQDTFSPFKNDFNESWGAGTVTFDATYDTDGIAVDTAAMTVTVRLSISGGTPASSDTYTIDLKGITNPAVPKGPESGGYTVDIKVKRGTPAQIVVNKISMPYFIQEGGSRSITVKVYAGTAISGTAGATGTVHMWGGGPGGPMDKQLTLTNGITTAVNGTAIDIVPGVVYSSLPDGCYNFGTEPLVTLGGLDYFGQMSPEPVCVNAATPNVIKSIVLAAASGAGTVNVTVKFAGIASFNGADVDIFAGGPGRFVVKTLTGLNAPDVNGYSIALNANGPWNIGVGPAMSKGTSMSMPKSLPGIPPPPAEINVSGLPGAGAISQGFRTPPGVTVDTVTRTITFTFATADKTVSGTVNDGTTGLANVQVFMHALGFGLPAFTTTKSDGTFSLSVSDYGTYEIGVMKDGLPPAMNNIEIRLDGADTGTDPDIFYKGKQITGSNPLVIAIKKGAYTISGKVLDSNNKAIGYAPIFATDTNGNAANGGTSSDGSYSIFVDAGTWTVKSMMPPDKTDVCGTFEKTVVITTESKSSQNITPSTGTCYTLGGTITVTGVGTLNNVPVSVAEWDTTNNRPTMGGMRKGTGTNSEGAYSIKVAGAASPGKTYRISVLDTTYGELSTTVAVIAADVTNAHITSGVTGTVTFVFTGGTSSNEAFIELKKADDAFTRISKKQTGLASSVTFTMKEGTYNYFVDVFGVGKYSGTVATGATTTIDLSGSLLVTLSGNVKDSSGANVSGASIAAKASDNTLKTTTTNSFGNYSLSVKAGTYTIFVSKAQYIAGQAPASITLSANTANYDFGGASPDQAALKKSDQVISGIVYQSNGITPATGALVSATEAATSVIVAAPADPVSGAYSLPVDDGTWTIKAVASLHAKTTRPGTVTVSGTTDSTGNNITLTANAARVSSSSSASLSAAGGGSVNDAANTGVSLTAGPGVLAPGNVGVTLQVQQTTTAPDTTNFRPLGDAAFRISAGNSENGSAISDLTGDLGIQIDYTVLLSSLPNGVNEANLILVYYSTEKDAYVPVEGGFTVDTTNNTITGQVDHLTDFMIVYSPVTIASSGSASDLTPPSAATSVAATATSSAVTVTWTNPADSDFYRTKILRNAGGSTPVSGSEIGVVSRDIARYIDSTVSSGTTYIYQLKSCDTSNNCRLGSEVTIAVQAAAVVSAPAAGAAAPAPAPAAGAAPAPAAAPVALAPAAAPVARLIHDPSQLTALLTGLGETRKTSEEAKYMPLIKSDALAFKVGLTAEQETAITNFVSYGVSDKTKKLGAGERRAVVRDYLETVGRGNVNWDDVERMTKGEKPVSRNLEKERAQVGVALTVFTKLYGHAPNFQDAKEDLSWNTLLYRIRFTRDLVKEKTGIGVFRALYSRIPRSTMDWATVRVLGYVK